MELLLDECIVPTDTPRGKDTFFDPLDAYADAAIKDLAITATLPNGTQDDALAQMRRFWGASNAMVVIDEMHSASRGYLRKVCEKLGINCTVIHGEKDPLLGTMGRDNPSNVYFHTFLCH
jgi:phosphomannomutase